MPVVVILLSVLLMFSMALATALQRTMRTRGLLPAENLTQTVILLTTCLRWRNVAFLLGTAVYLVAARASAWYYGVALVALCWVGSLLLMGTVSFLRPDSAQMEAILMADLERRRDWYRAAHNTARLHAVEELLARARAAPRTHASPGLRR